MATQRIGFDLDGTLAKVDWTVPYDPYKVGEPITSMIRLVQKHLVEGDECFIFTARASRLHLDPTVDFDRAMQVIKDFCIANIGCELEITNEKDYRTRRIYDDIARQVIVNAGIVVEAQ